MEIPKIGDDKFVLITADIKSGIILNLDGTYYLGQGDKFYHIIDGEENAISYAYSQLKIKKDIEIMIYDGKGNFVTVLRGSVED